jgi:hypothetical protein
MKTIVILTVLLVLTASFMRAEDWVTTDGKTYRNAKALSHDAGYVTIMYADGGARVPLATLPPDLQKRFGYAPAQAAAVVAATTAADKRDHAALSAEDQSAETNRKKTAALQSAQETQRQAALHAAPSLAMAPSQHPPAPGQPQAVDVFANNLKIQQDKEELVNLGIDLRDAEGNRDPSSSSGTGRGIIGTSSQDTITALRKRYADLKAEIAKLEKENKAAAK